MRGPAELLCDEARPGPDGRTCGNRSALAAPSSSWPRGLFLLGQADTVPADQTRTSGSSVHAVQVPDDADGSVLLRVRYPNGGTRFLVIEQDGQE